MCPYVLDQNTGTTESKVQFKEEIKTIFANFLD